MVHSEDFAMIALLSSLLLNIPRMSHACFVPTICEETIVDYFGDRREGGSKTQIILKFDEYSENLFQRKIILPRSSSGKGELSGVLSPACLATPCHRHWNPVYLFKDAGSWRDIWKKAEKFWKLPGRQQSKGTHSKLNCLCGNFQFWQIGKCWWGTFSSDFSDDLHYSTCDWFRLQPLQILCQAAYFSWASSSTEEQVSRTQTIREGIPEAWELA